MCDSDVAPPRTAGLVVQDGWSLHGSGSIAELDQVQISEQVGPGSRDNPPFTSVGAITGGTAGHTSGYAPGNVLSADMHTYAWPTSTLPVWHVTTRLASCTQLCISKCRSEERRV